MVGDFLHSHPLHRVHQRVSVPTATLAVGYASTVVLASPVGYVVMGMIYAVTVGFDVRATRRVKPAHACLAVAYVATGLLYPAGITVVGAAYAYSVLSSPE